MTDYRLRVTPEIDYESFGLADVKRSWNTQVPFYKVLIVGERGGRIKPQRKFSIPEIGVVLAWPLSSQKLTRTHTPMNPSSASVALYLALLQHQNWDSWQPNLALGTVHFIRALLQPEGTAFEGILGTGCSVNQWKVGFDPISLFPSGHCETVFGDNLPLARKEVQTSGGSLL